MTNNNNNNNNNSNNNNNNETMTQAFSSKDGTKSLKDQGSF